MARQRRHTLPLETVGGTLTDFGEIDRLLVDGEIKGRAWAHERSRSVARQTPPTDDDVRALHREMFAHVLPWAGEFRHVDVGPGGVVHVPHWEVPIAMRAWAGDLQAWVAALPQDPTAEEVAGVIADAHHRFQWVHPFQDTNGRTGRVLDAYLLWVTFGLARAELDASPIIEPFPSEADETEYYDGLTEADGWRPERLRRYYTGRVLAALAP